MFANNIFMIITHVLNTMMSVLCACIFVGPVHVCALKDFPVRHLLIQFIEKPVFMRLTFSTRANCRTPSTPLSSWRTLRVSGGTYLCWHKDLTEIYRVAPVWEAVKATSSLCR